MSESFTTSYTSRDPSTTGSQKRTVEDKIRNLFEGASTLLALISRGKVVKGELTKQAGMIGKKSCSHRRYEFFTYTPWVTVYTVVSVDGSNITLDSVTGLSLKRTVLNDNSLDFGRVQSIDTGTNVITVLAVTSTFTCVAGDKVIVMAPAYPEASSDPYMYMKTEDNNYNCMQILRYPWQISRSANVSDYYMFGKKYLSELEKRTMIEGNLLLERSFFFSERCQTSTTDLTADSTLGDSFSTMRGFCNFASRGQSLGNSMTPEKWIKDIPQILSPTINNATKLYAFTSKMINGEMQMWAHDKYIIQQSGELKQYGVKSTKYMTAGPEIEVIPHALFDNGRLRNKMFIMAPDDMQYVYRDGRDLHINPKEIQGNSSDSIMREVIGEVTCADLSGGESGCMLTDWFAL